MKTAFSIAMATSMSLFLDLHAQDTADAGTAVPERIHAQTSINKVVNPGGLTPSMVMVGIAPPEGEVIGDPHLEEDWRKGSILLYQDEQMIQGYPLKYDIQADVFEIKTDKDIKGLEGKKVKSFLWEKVDADHQNVFVNAKDYKENGQSLIGFFEVLVDGPMPLFKKTEVTIQKANYVKEFDTGSRNDKILKKVQYYYADGKTVTAVPKKKLASIFKDKSGDMEQFIASNKLGTKEEGDLVQIFRKYNTRN